MNRWLKSGSFKGLHKETLEEAVRRNNNQVLQESETQFKADNSKPKNTGKFCGKLRKYNEVWIY